MIMNSDLVKREDLLKSKKQFEDLIVNSEIQLLSYHAVIKAVDEELLKYPEEVKDDDPMPKEVEEVASMLK